MAQPMQAQPSLTVFCGFAEGCLINCSQHPSWILEALKSHLAANLGATLYSMPGPEQANIRIWLMKADKGNRVARYMVPFVSPVRMDVVCELFINGKLSQQFLISKRADFGLYGGDETSMFQRLAKRIAKEVSKQAMALANTP